MLARSRKSLPLEISSMPKGRLLIRTLLLRRSRTVASTLRSLAPLRSTAELIADTHTALAGHITAAIPTSTPDNIDRAAAASLFIRSARRTCAWEFLELASRHWPESLLLRRRAMEMMACAWKCWQDPGAARKWLSARDDWQAYESVFSPGNLRGALDDLVKGMNQAHKSISGFVHPSVGSIVMSIPSHNTTALHLFEADYFDDRVVHRAGYGRSLSAERILDSQAIHALLIRGFCNRAFATRWQSAGRAMRRPTELLMRRVIDDQRFYRHTVDILGPYRVRGRARATRRMAAPGSGK